MKENNSGIHSNLEDTMIFVFAAWPTGGDPLHHQRVSVVITVRDKFNAIVSTP